MLLRSQRNANIIESSQYSSDPEGGTFFIRIEFHLNDLINKRTDLEKDFEPLAEKFEMIIFSLMPIISNEAPSSFQKKHIVYSNYYGNGKVEI